MLEIKSTFKKAVIDYFAPIRWVFNLFKGRNNNGIQQNKM